MSSKEYEHYYVPAQSKWPIIGAVGLFFIVIGAAALVNQFANGTEGWGGYGLTLGLAIIIFMVFGWFKNQIDESMAGMYSAQLGESYRQGMAWFIFSEVMFFAAFFGALFYARQLSVPWLAGEGNNAMTGEVLWNGFQNIWPLEKMPDGRETEAMPWTGLPLYNTLLLLTSSVTLHFAHVGIEKGQRGKAKIMMGITILLGIAFLILQVEEYIHAYTEMNLTLDAGIYGNTFFMLTGFHGMHVTLGTIMLIVMFLRILKGHFTHDNHFAFLAASWYWHFVDVVWLGLFIFVYII
jgi:cytochrome c oxidase subunit 3